MIGILLINLGSPNAPTTLAVRRFLREFLSDPRVVDIHPVARWFLVNGIIAPFRSPKSAEAYQKIWTGDGSPLLVHTLKLAQAVSEKLGKEFVVEFGMRYGTPSIREALRHLLEHSLSEIRVLPLFPQFASSSTGSALEETFRCVREIGGTPPMTVVPHFYSHPGFIDSFAQVGRPVLERLHPDHVLFSFHGLPERQIRKADPTGAWCLSSESCCDSIAMKNEFCYRAQCFETARLLASTLQIPETDFSITFQSRLGRTHWITPATDLALVELAHSGKKRIAVFCPAFVADCLETLEEIGLRGRKLAFEAGAEAFELIPSLNASPVWVDAVSRMLQDPAPVSASSDIFF